MPLLLAACQSTPAELANDLAEPAVVTASADPGDAQTPEATPVPRSTEPQETARPRELVSVAPHPKAAVEMEELRAPERASNPDPAPETMPQRHAAAVPQKPGTESKPEPDSSVKLAATAKQEPAASTKMAAALNSEPAASPKTAGAFEWPVQGKIIETFGANENGQRNDGINIATDTGTPIHAAANGTVTYASNLKGYGNLVLIKHQNGYITAYAHAQKLLVSAGDQVDRGDVIGYAGKSGGVGTPQLHFEIRKGTKPVDPRPLMMAGRES
jgi:murein DD-endopeptidase MepM/ murein hydrolase activator NlpD